MKRNFTNSLIVSISIMAIAAVVYLLGASIIGAVTQTMYCEDGFCKKFCNFDTDCSSDNVCCAKGNFGVCDSADGCEAYALAPKGDYVGEAVELGSVRLESPGDVKMKYLIPVYVLLIAFLLAFVLYYFLSHKKKVPDKSKVVRKRVVKSKKK
ncbi:MAG: hypothetical protein ABIG93_04555 [archaeon]